MNPKNPPIQTPPDNTWEYFELWTKINELVRTLPNFFQSQIVVKGINATDVYAIGSRKPYPDAKKDASDSAEDDKGNNFGRVARAGQGSILENYLDEILNLYYLGIKIKHWLKIFKSIAEGRNDQRIEASLDRVLSDVKLDIIEQD